MVWCLSGERGCGFRWWNCCGCLWFCPVFYSNYGQYHMNCFRTIDAFTWDCYYFVLFQLRKVIKVYDFSIFNVWAHKMKWPILVEYNKSNWCMIFFFSSFFVLFQFGGGLNAVTKRLNCSNLFRFIGNKCKCIGSQHFDAEKNFSISLSEEQNPCRGREEENMPLWYPYVRYTF